MPRLEAVLESRFNRRSFRIHLGDIPVTLPGGLSFRLPENTVVHSRLPLPTPNVLTPRLLGFFFRASHRLDLPQFSLIADVGKAAMNVSATTHATLRTMERYWLAHRGRGVLVSQPGADEVLVLNGVPQPSIRIPATGELPVYFVTTPFTRRDDVEI